MNFSSWIFPVVLILMLGKWAMQMFLAQLNRRYVLQHADSVPDAFKDSIDPATYAKSVQYTLAKDRFGRIEITCDLIVLAVVLFSGFLPWAYNAFVNWLGSSAWALACCSLCPTSRSNGTRNFAWRNVLASTPPRSSFGCWIG
jgi:hypothetical protein